MDLGTPGESFSTALAINESGVVVGFSVSSNEVWHAFGYQNGLLSNLDARNGEQSEATAINDAGQIAGTILTEVTNQSGPYLTSNAAFVFNRGMLRYPIRTAGNTSASGINAWGEIVGGYSSLNGWEHAFAWRNGLLTDLGTLGGSFSAALGVNIRGDIVGVSSPASRFPLHPFLFSHGLMHDLGSFGGNVAMAYAINDNGDVVGFSNTASNLDQRPFLYSHGRMHDLGTLGGTYVDRGEGASAIVNYATAINNRGQIVGSSLAPDGSMHAFLYRNGTMTDLNDLVNLTAINGPKGFLALAIANGINERGQIVGDGPFWDGTNVTYRAFLLNLKL